jgi:hypothetical protein
MKSLNSQTRLERSLNSGWTVHIYNGERQLLCTLGPSHGWSLAAGTAVGILFAIIGFNLSNPQMANSLPADPLPVTPPLQVD